MLYNEVIKFKYKKKNNFVKNINMKKWKII